MATPRSQRVAIWLIAIVLAVGTIGSFFVLIIANQNQTDKAARIQQQQQEFEDQYIANQQKWAEDLSDKYYDLVSGYQSEVASFNSKSVDELQTEDLEQGSGSEIQSGDSYYAYYIGWNPRGVVFDSSIEDGSLRAPLTVSPANQMIDGWTEGVIGMKKGGVRLLTIPADMAYGSQSRDNIPANSPLKFVVIVIEDPEPVAVPEISDELNQYYKQQGLL